MQVGGDVKYVISWGRRQTRRGEIVEGREGADAIAGEERILWGGIEKGRKVI